MADRPGITRRGLAALAAAAAGLPARAQAEQAQPAAEPSSAEARLKRASDRLARCQVPRDTQPAIQFLP